MIEMILEFMSLVLTGMVAGALMYCAHVEVGARKCMVPQEKGRNWRYAIGLAGPLLKTLSIMATVVLITTGYMTGNTFWYIAAVFTAALPPP